MQHARQLVLGHSIILWESNIQNSVESKNGKIKLHKVHKQKMSKHFLCFFVKNFSDKSNAEKRKRKSCVL
jgi:hypothetical protein